MPRTFKVTAFLLTVVSTLCSRTNAQAPVTPDSKFVQSLVRPAVDFLKQNYGEDKDYGHVALAGLAIFNAELRQGKSSRDILNDRTLNQILVHVSKEVVKEKPESTESISAACWAGILMLEVNPFKYKDEINQVLHLLEAHQNDDGVWGSVKDQERILLQTQEATLFHWLAFKRRFNVKASAVTMPIKYLTDSQDASGRFFQLASRDKPSAASKQHFTAAGLGSLYLISDALGPRKERYKEAASIDDSLNLGNAWFAKNQTEVQAHSSYAYLHSLEQYYSFKERYEEPLSPDWYANGAKFLKSKQTKKGTWQGNESAGESRIQATAYAILFLVRSTNLVIPTHVEIVEGGSQKLPAKGPLKTKESGKDPADHWIVRYVCNGKRAYAKQLDYFKIEIAAINRETQQIEYAESISGSKPRLRLGTRKAEDRVYFKKPDDHPALKWDKSFLQAAHAKIDNHEIRVFYPAAVYRQMHQLEQQVLLRDGMKPTDIRSTIFTVEPTRFGGYEFKLMSIRYKKRGQDAPRN